MSGNARLAIRRLYPMAEAVAFPALIE
jgi:hypothetical protein